MRVTERTQMIAYSRAQNRAAMRLANATRVASSGQRVSKPSDDPSAYGSKVRRDYALALLEEHATNASRAGAELEVAENSLAQGVDLIERAQEAAMTGANSTSDARSRKLLAEDVRTMRDELMSIANTRYGNRYLFSGTRTDLQPFDTTTGAFQGNDQVVRVPVLDGTAPVSNVSGAKAFTSAGGRDLFADLDALSQALETNDVAGIQASLGTMATAHTQLIRSQVEAGFGAERFRNAMDVLVSTKTAITERLNQEIEGDPVSQLTELSLAKTGYERSIAVTKQLLSINTG